MPSASLKRGVGQQPFITFLSDYGRDDEFVGVCHGVIARRCPQAQVIDITHGIARHDVRAGALALTSALQFMPPGVHLAVVDPEVGASGSQARRAVALRVAEEERLLVGPDNGLLLPAARLLGGIVEAVDIGRSPERLEPVSATFHGRDIFAPVAAALAAGELPSTVGEPIAIEELYELELSVAQRRDGALELRVQHVDHFGNLILDAPHSLLAELGLRLGQPVSVQIGEQAHQARYVGTFADVAPGDLLLYQDSRLTAALAVNRGSAAEALGLERDGRLSVGPA